VPWKSFAMANRTHERAVDLAQLFQRTPVEHTRVTPMLAQAGMLIARSGATRMCGKRGPPRRGDTPVEYTRFTAMLPEVDILIASSGAPHYILHKDEMQRVISARRNRPMFLIDIAVPRNIEPSINELDNVFLYDIDDLQEVVNSNLRERMKEADRAEG